MHLISQSLCLILLSSSFNIFAMDPPPLPADECSHSFQEFTCFTVAGETFIRLDNHWLKVSTDPGISKTSFSPEESRQVNELYQRHLSREQQKDKRSDTPEVNHHVEKFEQEIADAKSVSIGEFRPNRRILYMEQVKKLVRKVLNDEDFKFVYLDFDNADLLTQFVDNFICGHKQNLLAITYNREEAAATGKALGHLIQAVALSSAIDTFELTVNQIDSPIISSLINAIKKNKLLTSITLRGKFDITAANFLIKSLHESSINQELTINLAINDAAIVRKFDEYIKPSENSSSRLSYKQVEGTLILTYKNDDRKPRRKHTGITFRKLSSSATPK